jgi:hypothetical protein
MSVEVRTGAVVVDTSESPFATQRPVAIDAVTLRDTIWAPRQRLTFEKTVPGQYQLLEESERLANFRRAAGKESGTFYGLYFNDTDVYKWLEAAAWTMISAPSTELDQLIDSVVQELADAQLPDGYLDNFYAIDNLEGRWTELTRTHELYCAGHLFQAAVAHYRATGKTNLLTIACKFADLLCDTFGPAESGKMPGTDGHEEVELALVELGRATGNQRYIEQAGYFLDARGYGLVGGDEYHQDHVPFRESTAVVGHAVRQVYLTAGAADLYLELGDPEVLAALDRLWDNMVQRRMYVSSGIGSRWEGESFGKDFELPNSRAYTESCAAIGSVMWNWRMLLIRGDAKYADLIETTLYNGMLPGLSLSGDAYYYQNPLSDDGTHRREPWFDCACCPPNIARTLASINGYVASVAGEELSIHLYLQSDIDLQLPTGQRAKIAIDTNYPWESQLRFTVQSDATFTLKLRIPGWVRGASLTINGEAFTGDMSPGSYASIARTWAAGDVVELDLPMPVRRVVAHPDLFENTGRVAVLRGPLLFCAEEADNTGIDPRDAVLPASPNFAVTHDSELLGGVTTLSTAITVQPVAPEWSNQLYADIDETPEIPASTDGMLTLIPYFVWANREPGRMEVWLRSNHR